MAKGSGRRSLADLNAADFTISMKPTRRLTKSQKSVWDRVMSAWPADHWVASDADLLTHYCAIVARLEQILADGDIGTIDRLAKLEMAYARSLRITPQSRYTATTSGREADRGRENDAGADRLLGKGVWANLQESNPN